MMQELTNIIIGITKNEETTIVGQNSHYAVRFDRGIQIIKLTHNMESTNKKLDYLVSFIPTPKRSPANELLLTTELLRKPMKNLDYTEMILDSAFWPHNKKLTEEMTKVVSMSWSPERVFNNQYLLAVLNNLGNIEFFGPQKHNYISVYDLSKDIKAHLCPAETPIELEELITTVKSMQTLSVCWGTKLNTNSIYFVTAQSNGSILVWLIQFGENIKAVLQGTIETGQKMHSMLWIQKTVENILLICSNSSGQIYAYDCSVGQQFIVINQTCLWTHEDRMVAKYLVHKNIDNNIALIFNKHRHLVILLLDKDCNMLTQVVKNINDNRITDIRSGINCAYLSTVNFELYKIYLSITDTGLNVKIISTEFNPIANSELYSFEMSDNESLFVLGTFSRQIPLRKDIDKLDVTFFLNTTINETELLLNNPSKKLTHIWDCLQLIRCKCVKEKALPDINFVELYRDGETDLYKLKLYLIFLYFNFTVEKINISSPNYNFPEKSISVVKEKILLAQAKDLINELYSNCENNKNMLSPLELEFFIGAKNFIQYFSNKYKRDLNELVDKSILNLTKMETQYSCQCCEEILCGLTCKNGHLNMFCMLTLTPIESDDYLFCENCNSTARIEMCDNNAMCIFCDLYLVKA